MSLLFFSNRMAFFMHFYVPFHFFKVLFHFASIPKQAFCKSKTHRGTPKGGKMALLFFCNRMAFFMHFYVPFHFFKVLFHFASLPKPAFWKRKAHWRTPKRGKKELLFFSNRRAFFSCIFKCHFIF